MNDQQVMHAMHIDDSYRVERVLTDGVSGTTELVTADGIGPFVRKKIPNELARRRVWSTLSECNCPRLPHVEATYELPEQFVVVYDFVPGASLEHLMRERAESKKKSSCEQPASERNEHPEALAASEAIRMTCEICEAASALHSHSIVHRDISPANVIMAPDGAHLIDLGIARMRVEGASRDTASLGTWGFASPEQYGFAQTDARSDVYSIGRLLGYAPTGVMPGGPDYDAALLNAGIDSKILSIIDKACAFEPSNRYLNAQDLSCALREATGFLTGEMPIALEGKESIGPEAAWKNVQEENTPKAGNPSKKARHLAAACVIAVLGVLALIIGFSTLASKVSLPTNSEDGSEGAASAQGDKEQSSPIESDDSLQGSSLFSQNEPTVSTDAVQGLLEIVESGWSITRDGYVNYAFVLRNTSDSLAVRFPEIRITGKTAEGSVLFSTSQVLFAISAGETTAFASIAGNGTPPASLEITAVAPQSHNVLNRADAPAYAVSNTSVSPDSIGGVSFTGVVETMKAGSTDFNETALSVLLRDGKGTLVGGYSTFITQPDEGQSAPFEISSLGSCLNYASYEIVAQAW